MLVICVFFCIIAFVTETNVAPVTTTNVTQSVRVKGTDAFIPSPTVSTDAMGTFRHLHTLNTQTTNITMDTFSKNESNMSQHFALKCYGHTDTG